MNRIWYLFFSLYGLSITLGYGNNLVIQNITQSVNNISFTISWENSFDVIKDGEDLHDAVWVFIKYKALPNTPKKGFHQEIGWEHALINTDMTAHTMGSLLKANDVDAAPHNTGIMFRRNGTGYGDIAPTNVTINVSSVLEVNKTYIFKVFGVEMTHIYGAPYRLSLIHI